VFSAQAWHWMDPATTVPEVERVMKPGGTLGLIWNVRDDRVDWVARMSEIIHDAPSADLSDNPPELPESFGGIEVFQTVWTHNLDRHEIAELVSSRSHFIVQDEPTQKRILAELRHLLDTHPETRDLERIPVPYLTLAYRAELRPVP
jgi:SAM-dependent methyltransferase